MKTIICSHGFGVGADSRGMFTELAAALPQYRWVTFDYNEVRPNGDMIVAPLEEQAARLAHVIDGEPSDSILLCHSQGSIVAGLVDLSSISRSILLAPPVLMSMQRVVDKMRRRPGSVIDPDGVSSLPRTDGTTTFVPPAYLASLEGRDPLALYASIAATVKTTIVRATNDQVLGLTDVDRVAGARHVDLAADHDFTGISRMRLIELLGHELEDYHRTDERP